MIGLGIRRLGMFLWWGWKGKARGLTRGVLFRLGLPSDCCIVLCTAL